MTSQQILEEFVLEEVSHLYHSSKPPLHRWLQVSPLMRWALETIIQDLLRTMPPRVDATPSTILSSLLARYVKRLIS